MERPAVLGSIAALIIAPIAVLIGRYGRRWQHWAKVHTVLNIFTLILVGTAFGLGAAALPHPNEFFGEETDPHHQLGLAVSV